MSSNSPQKLWLYVAGLMGLALGVNSLTITDDPTAVSDRTFDYIIVGGGTAGLTIANRLTEDEKTTVLVIEAGKDGRNDARTIDPGLRENRYSAVDFSDLSWGYATTNQTVGGIKVVDAGKVLGGSSSMNGMQWTRGTVGQYDALEELGNIGWNFATMQKYMKKAEAFHVPNINQTSLGVGFDKAAHGTNGKIDTGFPNPYPCPECNLLDAFVSSIAQTYPGIRADSTIDTCDGDPRGVSRCAFSITPGSSNGTIPNIRSSSLHGLLSSLAPGDRPNLSILTDHIATKIIWKSKAKPPTPEGVAFEALSDASSSQRFEARVLREVIVTCGALGSPKFLELSGVGDRKILESFNISVVADLPSVGTNLQDQAGITNIEMASQLLTGLSNVHTPVAGAVAFVTLPQLIGAGPASKLVQSLQSTVNTRAVSIVSSGAAVSVKGMEKMLSIQARQMGQENAPMTEMEILFVPGSTPLLGSASWILIPQYRGTVHIASSDPRAPPAVNPNYLNVDHDFSLLVNISMVQRQIWSIPELKQFAGLELVPGASVQTEADYANYVTNNYFPVTHEIGTLSMLPQDMGGAVDSNLRVYGVKGVRVADASVLPIQVSAHLSSTIYGIAEKASDLIRGL